MLILIGIAVVVILAAACMYFYYRYIKANEALFAARRDAARHKARLQRAQRAAQEAEEQCGQLSEQLSTSMASTGQALNVARHIAVVRQQLEDLMEFIGYPDTAPAQHRHVEQHAGPVEPGMTPYGPRQVDPVRVDGHREIPGEPVGLPSDYTRPLPVTHPGTRMAGGTRPIRAVPARGLRRARRAG